jgi:hypothetical protein
MTNPLHPFVKTAQAVALYQRIYQQLGNDLVIFAAMNQVAQRRDFVFDLPTPATTYAEKHQEIEQSLIHQNLLNRQGVLFDLIEEIQTQFTINGAGVHAERLRDLVILETGKDFKIKIGDDGAWFVEWAISVEYDNFTDAAELPIVVYENSRGTVTPWDIVQYINSAVLLYKQKSYATALALASIALEAMLRDVLATRGYSFTLGANKYDIYGFSRAQVDVTGSSYTITFIDPMPKNPAELLTSAGGALPVDIQIRREKKASREDLLVKAPQFLLDHWAGNNIVQHAQVNNITGLGEALRIAREVEHIIVPADLPPDVDPVIKAVRNNLIHLSSDSMEEELPRYATPPDKFTVRDFIGKPNLVFDLLATIVKLTNKQFVQLWKNNIAL